jgi:hypothetical protein
MKAWKRTRIEMIKEDIEKALFFKQDLQGVLDGYLDNLQSDDWDNLIEEHERLLDKEVEFLGKVSLYINQLKKSAKIKDLPW